MPGEQAQRVADVLPQMIQPRRDPDGARVFLNAHGIAESAQGSRARILRGHTTVDVVLGLARDVVADFGIEIGQWVPGHAGLRTPAMACASLSHFDVSMASCFRPFAVRR